MSMWFEFRCAARTLLRTVDSWLEAKDREYTERVSMHDWDLPLADALAEAEEEVDVWEPRMECDGPDATQPIPFLCPLCRSRSSTPLHGGWCCIDCGNVESSPVASATSTGDTPLLLEGSGSPGGGASPPHTPAPGTFTNHLK